MYDYCSIALQGGIWASSIAELCHFLVGICTVLQFVVCYLNEVFAHNIVQGFPTKPSFFFFYFGGCVIKITLSSLMCIKNKTRQ